MLLALLITGFAMMALARLGGAWMIVAFWSLVVLHARFQFVETVRIPVAVLGNLLFPALALAFPARGVISIPPSTSAVSTR